MEKCKSWRKADYPNAIPSWRKIKLPKEKKTQVERVLASLDWDKLATIGKDEDNGNSQTQ